MYDEEHGTQDRALHHTLSVTDEKEPLTKDSPRSISQVRAEPERNTAINTNAVTVVTGAERVDVVKG